MNKKGVEAETVNNSIDQPVCKIIPLWPNGFTDRRKEKQAADVCIKDSSLVTLEASIITSHEILKNAHLSEWERRHIDTFYKTAVQSLNTLKRFI